MSDDVVIQVKGVYKDFKLPHEKNGSLKSVFTNIFKKKQKGYEQQHALKDISFEVKKGEFFGIVGRNGSGKSTLLKIMAEIYQPTRGMVRRRGRLVPFIELGVGFNPELSGRENVYLNGALLGFSKKEIDNMYDDIVEFAELEKFMDQKLKNYSSGMQVRLAFSVATRSNADILLIDEVLAVGDADFQRKCFNYFRKLKKNNKTVIFVSHDMEAVREYCDRCIFIKDSRKVFEGETERAAELYLEMFNAKPDTVTETSIDTHSSRWGNRAGYFKDIKVTTHKESVRIYTELIFEKRIERPIIGIQVTNAMGQPVCGTNTKILKQRVEFVEAGDRLRCDWVFPNIFSEGEYSIDGAITYADGITQADWWKDAVTFSIRNHFSTPHVTSPPIELIIDKV